MEYAKNENYEDIKISLKREENGSNLISYLEKAAADLNFYVEKSYLPCSLSGNLYLERGKCFNLLFFSPVSKLFHLYIARFSIRINIDKNYNSLNVIDEPLASLKKVKKLSGKLESKMEELLK